MREVHAENHRLILGTTEEVARQVLEYHHMFGDRLHFVMRLDYPGQDPVKSDRAIERWGQVAALVRRELTGARTN